MDNENVAAIREAVGSNAMELWREALGRASEDLGAQMAAPAMLLVAVEALRDSLGAEATAQMLDALARGVGSGADVTVSVAPIATEH